MLILLPLLGSSCASKSVLSERKVSTKYEDNGKESIWEGIEAKKKVKAKALRVLIVDRTNTHNVTQTFPLFSKCISEEPYQKDTVIENVYYNRLALDAFEKKLPLKVKLSKIYPQVSEEELNSLIQAGEYDLVIAARRICIKYAYDFHGYNAKKRRGTGTHFSNHADAIYQSIHRTTGQETVRGAGPYFDFSDRMPVLETSNIVWQADWDLHWIASAGDRKENTTHLTQEGRLKHNSSFYNQILTLIGQEIGQSLAQVFVWRH